MALVKLSQEELQSLEGIKPLNPSTGVVRGAADAGVNLLKGTLMGGKMLSDAVSAANNPVSDVLDSGISSLDALRSQGAKDQDVINAARMKNAEQQGGTSEIKAGVQNFLESPIDTTASGLGTMLPALAAQKIPGIKSAAAKNVASSATGGAMGAGAVKGEIYDAVKRAHMDAGKTEQEASLLAAQAQSYTGENADQIALGAGLGVAAGGTGVESIAARLAAKEIGAQAGASILKSTLLGGVKEAIPEAVQGGQERFASNTAQAREGFDVDPWQGVAGNATLEALAASPLGGAAGAYEHVAQSRANAIQALDQAGEDGAITGAAKTAVATGAADVAVGAVDQSIATSSEELPQRHSIRQDAIATLAETLNNINGNRDANGNIITTPAVADAASVDAVDNGAGGAGDLADKSVGERGGVGPTSAASAQSSEVGLPAGTETGGDVAVNANPFKDASDDVLPTLRGMTTEPTIIAQIDEEIARRGIGSKAVDIAAHEANGNNEDVDAGGKWDRLSPSSRKDILIATGSGLAYAEQHSKRKFHELPDINKRKVSEHFINERVADQPSVDTVTAPSQGEASPIDTAAHEAATSPNNDRAEPTDAQKEAGNYKKGKTTVSGLNVSIENPQGSVRSGTDRNGKAWETPMQDHYGYIAGVPAKASDKDHVDTFIKAGTPEDYAGDVYVVDQNHPDTGKFDEPKVMIGYASEQEAQDAYHRNYQDGWNGMRQITRMSMDEFKAKLQDAKAFTKPQEIDTSAVSVDQSAENVQAGNAEQITLMPGDTFSTLSDRITTPFPNYSKNPSKAQSTKDEKALRQWLKDNAIAEAEANGDDFNLTQFKALDPSNWSQSDGDSVNLYLFGDETGRIGNRKVGVSKPNQETNTPADGVIARVGTTPKNAQPVTIKNGIIHIGDDPAIDYESGEDVKATGTDFASVKKALQDAGVLSSKDKVFVPLLGKNAGQDDTKASSTSTSTAPEHQSEAGAGVDDRELGQIVAEFNEAQQRMVEDGERIHHLMDAPAKSEIVRLADKVKVYHKDHGWMTVEQAKVRIAEWKQHAQDQYDNDETRSANSKRIVLSLFDLTGKWSQPWEEAGYQVYRFDIQNEEMNEMNGEEINTGDINNFGSEFFADIFGDFDGNDIYAILAACPCTDFAVSGARHFAAKDADGRTIKSVKLVHMTLATIEHFKPAVWAIENPVGRIESLGGLPPWRLSFDPNHLGDPYTKKTLLWGRFNADLPIAPVEPTEGSKMHAKYGGKSLATKNARSATPEGFAYGFFMANNAADHPVMAIANKYDRLDRSLIEQAVDAGIAEEQINEAVEDFYYQDLDDDAANQAIRDLLNAEIAKVTDGKLFGDKKSAAEQLRDEFEKKRVDFLSNEKARSDFIRRLKETASYTQPNGKDAMLLDMLATKLDLTDARGLPETLKFADGKRDDAPTIDEVKPANASNKKNAVAEAAGFRKKVTAHKRDFERSLFNAAIALGMDGATNPMQFAAKHTATIESAITEMRKDSTPEQASALDRFFVDGKLKMPDSFWKSVYKEVKKASGDDRKKLENTGLKLRRWWQLNKGEVSKAKDWKGIEKLTARAKVFNPVLAEGADENLTRYIDAFRVGAIKTFGDFLERHKRWRIFGPYSRHTLQQAQKFLDGDAYSPELGQDATPEQRLQFMKDLADEYLTEINTLNVALSGAKTIDEFTEKLESHMHSLDVSEIPDWITFGTSSSHGRMTAESNDKKPENVSGFYRYNYGGESEADFKVRVLKELNAQVGLDALSKVFGGKFGISSWYKDGGSKAAAELEAGSEKESSSRREALTRPRLDQISRKGRKDYRNGRDVTPQEVKDTFGFADVGFGEYVNAANDQKHLNHAYDAFKDLAAILGLPDKAIGLGGKLHFTIGALGQGKFAAHYEDNQPVAAGSSQTVHVINLTNTRGDGTVAHEWMHALDYHLMHYDKDGYVQLNRVRDALKRHYDFDHAIAEAKKFAIGSWRYRNVRGDGIAHAMYHMKHGGGAKAVQTGFKVAADLLGKDYWGNDRELWARAAEAYVFDQFGDTESDYLVTDWVADGKTTEPKYRGTPYPMKEERQRFNAAFKPFFAALKVAHSGIVLDVEKFKETYTDPKVAYDEKIADLIENMPGYVADWKEARRKEREVRQQLSAEDQQRIDEQKRREEARIQAELAAAMKPENKDGALSDADLEALFDEAATELREETAEQPDVVIGEPQVSEPSKPKSERKPSEKRESSAGKDDKTAAKLAAEAAKLGVTGIDQALTGLAKLFGAGNGGRLNSFPSGFDEEAYNEAKPHFEAALKAFVEAGKTLKDLFKFLIQNLGEGVKPYAIQFAKENELGAQLSQEGSSNDESGQGREDDRASDEGQSPVDVSGVGEGEFADAGDFGQGRVDAGGNPDGRTGVSGSDAEGNAAASGDAAEDDRGSGDSQLDGVRTGKRGDAAGSVQRVGKNFVIPAGGLTRQGSWRETAARNLDIIELAKKLEEEGRSATPQEQSLLSKYTGFGASDIRNRLFPSSAFSGGVYRPSWVAGEWRDLAERAANLLTKEELLTMLRSTQYAHYTSEGITRGIWDILNRLGFTGGNMIEPGMGSGNFIGTMPAEIAAASQYTGIEYDHLTSLVAKYLYPESNVIQGDYTVQKMPDGYFDLGIGNPPFSQTKISNDPRYKKYGFALHDYFFAKTIDKVRDGGLLVFVTSKGTMDKNGDRARKYLAERADLVGAIRLPQTAFKENAGTEVVTDVLILRKRGKDEQAGGQQWLGLKEIDTPQGKTLINEYFADHPEMILGESALTGTMYRANEYTVIPHAGTNIEDEFAKAAARLPEKIYSANKSAPATQKKAVAERDMNPKHRKEGGLYLDDKGNLMIVDNGTGVDASTIINMRGKDEAFLKDYVALRDALKQARYDQWNDGAWEQSLKDLNKAYDAFVKKHGNINAFTVSEVKETNEDGIETTVERRRYKNWRIIRNDVEGSLVWALEDVKEDGSIVKAPALLGRTIKKPQKPKIETVQDALAVVLDEYGHLDIDKIAEYANTERDTVLAELGDLVFETPAGQWLLRDEYLSGEVIDKLEEAEEAAKLDKRFNRNVQALLLVQPKPLSANDVTVSLGANWVPADVIQQFADDVMEYTGMTVEYSDATAAWKVEAGGSRGYQRSRTSDWGTSDKSAPELLAAVLNSKSVDIRRSEKLADGSTRSWLDEEATAQVNDIMKKMRERFKSWVWTDAQRAERMLAIYNRKFNNIAPRQFDGSHLSLPGVTTRYTLHPHQKRAIWRVIQTGNTYLAHAVGAGKTYEMIASGMEQRRLGMIRRPMYVVPNHMLEQFSTEFIDLYPTANVMVADKDNFHKDNRKRFMAQAAVNDPDAIVITHSAFGLLSLTPENYDKIVQEQIDMLQVKLEDAQAGGDRVSIRQVQQQIEQLEKKLKGKLDAENKDAAVTFEDLGVDFLFVDEAHEFRKLDFATNRTKVKGIDPNGSKRAIDLYAKIRYLESLNPGRTHVFASGTPVTNTMGELYTVMRFFAHDELEKTGLLDFDAWATQFGDVVADYEANSAGKYELVERFSKFQNVPELMKRVRSFMDVLTSSNLGTLVTRPNIIGGQRKIVITPQPQNLKEYMRDELQPRIERSKKWKPSPDQPNNPDPIIAIIGDARLANIDMRFVDPTLPSDPDSKLNQMIDGIIDTYRRTKDVEFHDKAGNVEPVNGATQIVFANVGFGEGVARSRGFSAKDWVNKRLTDAGIKASEIAWMMDYDTSTKKESMFKEMRTGQKKILFGSPKNMGTGTNVQARLYALHYLDSPWYPSDLEQPEGRIIRQGNKNKNIELYAYATKGSYDSTMWQMVARKGRFIEQAFTGDDAVRTLEDISESSQYQMASALASGDNRVIELAGLEADVVKYNRLKDAHATQQRELRTKSAVNEASIREIKQRILNVEEAEKLVGTGLTGEVEFAIGKEKHTERAKAGEAIIKLYDGMAKTLKAGAREVIGKVGGKYTLSAVVGTIGGVTEVRLAVRVTDKLEFTVDSGHKLEGKDPAGLATRIINQVNRIRQMRYEQESELQQAERERGIIQSKIGAPFEYDQELNEKIAAAARLKAELAAEGEAAAAEAKAAEQAKPQGGDDVVFSRGTSSTGSLPREATDAIVAAIKAKWSNAPEIVVVNDMNDPRIRKSVRDENQRQLSQGAKGNPEGFYDAGKVYVVASEMNMPQDVVRVLLHETLGHYGLRGTYGKELQAILKQIVMLRRADVAKKAEQYGLDMSNDKDALIAAEEVLAEMAQTKPEIAWVKKAVAVIKAWLRKTFPSLFADMELTDDDIVANYLLPARNFVVNGPNGGGGGRLAMAFKRGDAAGSPGIRFSRSATMDDFMGQAGGIMDALGLGSKAKKIDGHISQFEQENRRLREEHIGLWDKAKTWLKRQLAPGGLLPESVFAEKVRRDNEFQAIEFDVAHLVGQLENAIKADYGIAAGDLDEKVQSLLGDALAGKVSQRVPEATRTALLGMRQYIDGLSKQYLEALADQINMMVLSAEASGDQALLAQAIAKSELYETIMGNLGEYVHRSYRAFDDKDWPRKVPDAVLDNARLYLMARFAEEGVEDTRGRAEVVLNEILKHGTAYESMGAFIRESKLGAKDLSVLKRRKEIAPEIRALLGEYTDPRVNFAKSATKMGRMIWNQRFLENIRRLGMGEFFFTGATKPPEATSKIAAEGSEVMAPLNGLWVTPDVNQAFTDALGKEQMADWYRAIVRINGMVKYGKTVLSPTTAARNWMSAFFFTVANGHFDMRHMAKAVDGLKEYFAHGGDAAKMAYLRKLKQLGVVYDTPYAGEMMRLLEDSNIADTLTLGKRKLSVKRAFDMATKFYQYGDDFWKIVGFENEKRLWMATGMSEADAEVKAAERIRNTYPTYSMVGRGIQSLRRFPLVGSFVSFPAEIIRTSVNMVRYLAEDYQNPATRNMAIRRGIGLAITSSFAYAAQAISMAALGIDDDDDDAVRQMAAPWQRNSSLWYTGRDEQGNIRYMDLSFLDPYNYWKRPVTAVLRGQPAGDAVRDVFAETLSPFFGTDIMAGAIFEVLANRKGETGAPVYKPHDDVLDQAADIANHLRKDLQPGIVSNMERTYKALDGETSVSGRKYDPADEAAGWVGFRMSTLDPKVALYYRSFDFKDAKAEAEKRLRDVIRDPGEVGDAELLDARADTIRLRARAYEDMAQLVRAAERSGMTRGEISQVLRSSGVSVADTLALMTGRVPGWRANPATITDQVRKARTTFGEAGGARVMERYRMLGETPAE